VYTRKKGLDRDTNKALLLKHIKNNVVAGSRMEELLQVLPSHPRSQIQVHLRELVKVQVVHSVGATRGARWYPGPSRKDCNQNEEIRYDSNGTDCGENGKP
jgi:ATP-dependent DNA helicase RecG